MDNRDITLLLVVAGTVLLISFMLWMYHAGVDRRAYYLRVEQVRGESCYRDFSIIKDRAVLTESYCKEER